MKIAVSVVAYTGAVMFFLIVWFLGFYLIGRLPVAPPAATGLVETHPGQIVRVSIDTVSKIARITVTDTPADYLVCVEQACGLPYEWDRTPLIAKGVR